MKTKEDRDQMVLTQENEGFIVFAQQNKEQGTKCLMSHKDICTHCAHIAQSLSIIVSLFSND